MRLYRPELPPVIGKVIAGGVAARADLPPATASPP
jgi:hypothetical protein